MKFRSRPRRNRFEAKEDRRGPIRGREDVELLMEGLFRLNFREWEILKFRYGMVSGVVLTLEELGRVFRISRSRVGQIQKKAEEKLCADERVKTAFQRLTARLTDE